MNKTVSIRQRLLISWLLSIAVSSLGFILYVVDAAIADDFSRFATDPGRTMFDVLVVILCLQTLMPILVVSGEHVILRWVVCVLAFAFGLFFMAHHLSHALASGAYGIFHVLDFTQDIISGLCIAYSIIWIRDVFKQKEG